MKTKRSNWISLVLVICASLVSYAPGHADDVLNDLDKATRELTAESYLLRYKYQAGESVQHEIEQRSAIDTTIQGNNMKTKLRTVSTRAFDVAEVTDEGNMKFAHRIVRVKLWNEVSGRKKMQFDSDAGQEPPTGVRVSGQTDR